ncbi:tetratricopeptide repeat protein [Sinosporangium siamense]|uniref:Tetratricopeptide repeat protein n=1 Tax=Sinosporangium siamense TaxID=1367973 RepID=A0A919RMR0_9ACTN|nr:tetratricopeptide repeat protein [Sinosporangium siamense]GII96042.1 hypothetical protein Ssi02_62730 [Sinosporangium siamense]
MGLARTGRSGIPGTRSAYAYESVGDLGRAIPMYETTLADCERILGNDHALTKTVRDNADTATG